MYGSITYQTKTLAKTTYKNCKRKISLSSEKSHKKKKQQFQTYKNCQTNTYTITQHYVEEEKLQRAEMCFCNLQRMKIKRRDEDKESCAANVSSQES